MSVPLFTLKSLAACLGNINYPAPKITEIKVKKEVQKEEPPKEEEKKPKVKMKKWPDEPTSMVNYERLIEYVKQILDEGYSFVRTDKKSFDYAGWNIGKEELKIYKSAKERFTEKNLSIEKKKYDRNLIDVVLNLTFQLGIEQGRRAERIERDITSDLVKATEQTRKSNKEIRIKNDTLAIQNELIRANPAISDEELKKRTVVGLKNLKDKRIRALKKDTNEDAMKSSMVAGQQRPKAKFHEVEYIYWTMSRPIYKNVWIKVLAGQGWTIEEWNDRCQEKIKAQKNKQ